MSRIDIRWLFQSLNREKPLCHSHMSCFHRLRLIRFQSLNREKPLCHYLPQGTIALYIHVSIAQTRKTSLPRSQAPGATHGNRGFNRSNAKNLFATSHWPEGWGNVCGGFQSLKRENPLCHFSTSSQDRSLGAVRFNRSNAKTLFATQCVATPWTGLDSFNRSIAKTLFATLISGLFMMRHPHSVSIAQSRKPSLPLKTM